MKETKAEHSRRLRYKRPALASLGYDTIIQELEEIREACLDIQYYIDSDEDTLLAALDGDEEEEFEFKIAFSGLSGNCEDLYEKLLDVRTGYSRSGWQEFDDCIVSLIGNRYNMVGFDGYEEDYYALTGYESDLAFTEAGKRMMRHAKAEMLSIIGQALGCVIAFLDVRQRYDYLKATMDILRDENTSLLAQIKAIEKAYYAAEAVNFRPWEPAVEDFDRLLDALPDIAWVG